MTEPSSQGTPTGRLQLVEQHRIDRNDPRWANIDAACFLSKNLYNAALYRLRQHFFATGKRLSYSVLAHAMLTDPDYCALPRKVSQWVLRQACGDWTNFWKAHRAYGQHPERFSGRPQLPRYKHRTDGRNLLVYTDQAVRRTAQADSVLLSPSHLGIGVKSGQCAYNQVRIVPAKTHYVVEVVYTRAVAPVSPSNGYHAAIDVGLNNLAAVTSDQPGFVPLLVNGRPLKSINQRYNKERARLQAALPCGQYNSHALDALIDKRNRQVKDYLHRASFHIVQSLVQAHIGTLIIGKNDGWKQRLDFGARTNQNFVSVPHAQFIEMLTYKAQLHAIRVIVHEESYTSKCSFLDLEPVGKHEGYAGQRVKRGLFRSRAGRPINADVNASYNILRKVIPDAFGNGIGGAVVHPRWLTTTAGSMECIHALRGRGLSKTDPPCP
jgi:putative transposase